MLWYYEDPQWTVYKPQGIPCHHDVEIKILLESALEGSVPSRQSFFKFL